MKTFNLHNIILLIVLVAFTIISNRVIGQHENLTPEPVEFSIHWSADQYIRSNNGQTFRIPEFTGSILIAETGSLPVFEAILPNGSGLKITDVQLDILETDLIPIDRANPYADEDLIGNEFRVYLPGETGNHSLLIVPMRKNGHNLERLRHFLIHFRTLPVFELKAEEPTPAYASESVLNKGIWYKMAVNQQGIHRISYDQLTAIGILPASIDPRNIRIYGNGNGMLPESNTRDRIDDLKENAIYVHGQEDNVFDPTDYILFYAEGPVEWPYNIFNGRFEHQVNLFSDTLYYFLTVADTPGLRLQQKNQATGQVTRETEKFVDMAHHEQELENLLLSGKEWFGESFDNTDSEKTFLFSFPDILFSEPVYFQIQYIGRSVTEDVAYSVWINDSLVIDQDVMTKLLVNQSTFARESTKTLTFFPQSPDIEIKVRFHANDIGSRGWLNYIRLNAWRNITFRGGQLEFRDYTVIGDGNITRFTANATSNNYDLWEITDPLRPVKHTFTKYQGGFEFVAHTDSLRTYIIHEPDAYHSILGAQQIPNQNLHGITDCDMLIICHPDFLEQAIELSEIHFLDEGLISRVVNLKDVYNEFASGVPDATAIRDFARMLHLRTNGGMRYLLLFGDASYDYKNRLDENTNFVPTYQSKNSLTQTGSFVSDDFFGLLGYDEGFNMTGAVDLGIGRLPVRTAEEAASMVGKIRSYLSNTKEVMQGWRNEILFVADDQDNNLHLDQAESLSKVVDTARNVLNIKKLYLDNYQQVSVPGGHRYPQANTKLIDLISKGQLIVNYTGHGGVNGLTDERVFPVNDIIGLSNYNQLPLFITATCEFSRFDDPHFESAGEKLILNPRGGAVALMTTTRLAWAHSNFALNKKLYEAMFSSNNPQLPRLGDVMRASKNPPSSSVYNFVLLGDPALRLVSPVKRVVTTTFNSIQAGLEPDTINAMSHVKISGKIVLTNGQTDVGFNGYLYPKVFDKKSIYRTLGNDNNSQPVNISYFDKLLYQGQISIVNGEFSFEFMLPKDISFQYGSGRISYYAVDTVRFTDASGVYQNLIVGGTDEEIVPDQNGPNVGLYINDFSFKTGGLISDNPVLIARLADPQGINHLGNIIGRDITLTINDEANNKYILNEYYFPDKDSYTDGTVLFPMNGLPQGKHTVRLKAWDLHNNSTEAETWFVLDELAPLNLSGLMNIPNPFTDETSFRFNHNKLNGQFDIIIDIFRIDGQWVASLEGRVNSAGGQSDQLFWNGRDHKGNLLPGGLYIYRLTAKDKNGVSGILNSKLIISR